MKKLTLLLLSVFALTAVAQVTTIPAIIQKGYTGEVTVIFNPNDGNGGMKDAKECYAHTGLITSASSGDSDWKFVVDSWCGKLPKTKMTKDGTNWKLVIPNIYEYYGCPKNTDIKKLAFVFNNGISEGDASRQGKTADGGDIFVELADKGLAVSINDLQEITTLNSKVTFVGNATASATLTLKVNGETVKTAEGIELKHEYTFSKQGNYSIEFTATEGTETAKATTFTCVPSSPTKENRPAGIVNGIYYDENDDTKVTLCTFAASKPVSAAKNITIKAQLPAHWTNTITAWVWPTGGNGKEVTPTKDGDWYVYTDNCAELNIIFKNGAGWNGDNNQTVDMCFSSNAVIKVTQSGSAKAGYEILEQEPEVLNPAQHVFVVGDFNNWTISNDYQLNQASDSAYFWIELDGLTPQKEYALQYVVVRADGQVKRISDLFSEKVLHPDDKYEPTKVDPTLMKYPAKGDGYVTVIQTDKSEYQWSEATLNFKRPDKNNLIIYELWVYDFTPKRTLNAVAERMDYLTSLGINAIELMPLAEFDGNYNWGYSPNHYFAFDKAYGTPEDLKNFVDLCHKHGIAVIIDMVFNHATGLNPMNKLYPYGTDLSKNPWFNTTAPHSDNVYEDWNHDFKPTKNMFTRALQYWLKEYKVDGFRMDLSHGLCGKTNNAMMHIADYYNHGVKAVEEDAYFILEHWGANCDNDRKELIRQGMLCWDNTSGAYHATAKGSTSASFANANRQGYVSYCESHDEERMQYIARKEGFGDLKTNKWSRLKRIATNVVFNTLLAGPHMIWQYEEIGYDFSINSDVDAPESYNNDNRCDIKPRPETYGYFDDIARRSQFTKIAQAIHLRTKLLADQFVQQGQPSKVDIGGKALRTIRWGNDVYVAGNFSVNNNETVTIPTDNVWYNYYDEIPQTETSITLAPGDFIILTGSPIKKPIIGNHLTDLENVIFNNSMEILPPYNVNIYSVNGQLIDRQVNVLEADLKGMREGLFLIQYEKDGQRVTKKVIR